MHCTIKIADDIFWVGGNDRRADLFEGVYPIASGMSYNAYLILDEMTVLVDTVDESVGKLFFENIEQLLNGRNLDYLIIQHMEPDHSATAAELMRRYPDLTVVCNAMTAKMFGQFYGEDLTERAYIVKEKDFLNIGKHEFTFMMAPMVHWPEVMVTYEKESGILFSADAFGTFGALDGEIFADEYDRTDEARRYYANIVGKYGNQVQALLKKASTLEIAMLCPLHGPIWRRNIESFVEKYSLWSSYTPEEAGVVIAYGSIYGGTKNAAEILAVRLAERGIKTVIYDVSITHPSVILAAAFKYSHMVFAAATYNAGIFVKMDDLLHDIAAHNLQNRTFAFIENGSWATMKGNRFIDEMPSLLSSVKEKQLDELDMLAQKLAEDYAEKPDAAVASGSVDSSSMFKLSYGLFVLTARSNDKDNGCIINTVQQVTASPNRISVTVNKQNFTHDMIAKTGAFNASVLSTDVPFSVFERFGFRSGRDTDKLDGYENVRRSENGLIYLDGYSNALISGRVIQSVDLGTHTLFIADVTEARILSDIPSVTYEYYFANIKPKPVKTEEKKKGFVCKICGYVYEGDELPPDFICPLCKHGAEDFEPLR